MISDTQIDNLKDSVKKYYAAKDMYIRCVNDPHSTWRDAAECAKQVQFEFERVTGWWWSIYRRGTGKVRPLRVVREDVQLWLDGCYDMVAYPLDVREIDWIGNL